MNVVQAKIADQRLRAHRVAMLLPDNEPTTVLDLLDAIMHAGFRLEHDRIGYMREAFHAEYRSQQESA